MEGDYAQNPGRSGEAEGIFSNRGIKWLGNLLSDSLRG
jgi:hypothetical protein